MSQCRDSPDAMPLWLRGDRDEIGTSRACARAMPYQVVFYSGCYPALIVARPWSGNEANGQS
ncbi:hypothetical protein FOXG_22254 [Fusarium oxysporum f. sp. lycopersici 4287]|uniref:Uncharacterized protein n=2 Tax=Fusarium oxysporum TaxID=5507 RepID=A0A0J9W5Z5_FUSO4|nr:hypothetical protein FOXG_22254 [Fusarium oxysporum f. sp. lycopersici 4287]EXK26750.1 hypothetical protein FOMG_16696 [Fusarium oxysporum f. sp. melonis 26406]KNB18489.1 hypothetical protein FOXG_22254 [Fusarium oxysporum f. sp. lycopersici 4287]